MRKIPVSVYMILLTGIIVIWVSSNYKWGDRQRDEILSSDACGYYAYLPSIFIYGDLNFNYLDSLINEPAFPANLKFDFREDHDGMAVDKFYVGTAIAQLPGFLFCHSIQNLFDDPADGYHYRYQLFIHIMTIIYLLGSLLLIRRLLQYFHVSDINQAITLLVIVFGTNVFHYSVSEPGMSHVYSLFFVSLFLVLQRRFFLYLNPGNWILSMIVLGVVVLIRPVNGMIVFIIPCIAGTFYMLKKGIFVLISKPGLLIFSFISFLVILSLQLIIYKIQTGDFWVYSYKEEGFNFLTPHFWDILFSYRKGLFVYTPLLFLILLAGGFKLLYSNPYQFVMWLVFFIGITWVLSSWHMWYYGGSFSSRVYIEYYPVFALLLGILLEGMKKKMYKGIWIVILFLGIALCQIQTYQYRTGRIHWSGMNKELYWKNFARIDQLIKF